MRKSARALAPLKPAEVKAMRALMGLTQRELAYVLRVTETTVARWERGERKVSGLVATSLTLLARQLGPAHRHARPRKAS